jgi:hypothetical protein
MRHWPWVAFAASQYRFERKQKQKYNEEPTPTEIRALVRSIAKNARALCQGIIRLQELSNRLGDIEAPDRRAHLAWLHEIISQNILEPSPQINDSPDAMVLSHFAAIDLCQRLTRIELAANAVDDHIAPELLRRPRMQGDRGLSGLVYLSALIWKSLTGRKASINKVTRARSADDRPDFVLFVSKVAKLSCNHEPTPAEIETAFDTLKAAKNKSE